MTAAVITAEEDWHMPIESSQYFIILFRVNKVFTFNHITVITAAFIFITSLHLKTRQRTHL